MIRDSFRMNIQVKGGLGSINLNLAKGKLKIDQKLPLKVLALSLINGITS